VQFKGRHSGNLCGCGPSEIAEHSASLVARVEEVIVQAQQILTEAKGQKSFGPPARPSMRLCGH